MYTEISSCRICGNADLRSVLNLGQQYLTGVFPNKPNAKVTRGPLELVRCNSSASADACGLVQLRHSYDLNEMYGAHYGYRSSLNRSMVEHLRGIVNFLCEIAPPKKGDVVVDIGSNDGTTLGFYSDQPTLVGIDPAAERFGSFYRPDAIRIPTFFSAKVFKEQFPDRKAKIVTSIAMFYDLERPLDFVKEVAEILADDGIWHFEQSYLPAMLRVNAYDTICHEHMEYYALKQIKWMIDRAGLKIIDVRMNDTNGGSFAISVARQNSKHPACDTLVKKTLEEESQLGLEGPAVYDQFKHRVFEHRDELIKTLKSIRTEGKRVHGYGASTKGNVILQFCELGPDDIECIAEVNSDKFGHYTPGTNIPIVSEAEARAKRPDYFLVLPWHFAQNILQRESAYLKSGGKIIFPLPEIKIVSQ